MTYQAGTEMCPSECPASNETHCAADTESITTTYITTIHTRSHDIAQSFRDTLKHCCLQLKPMSVSYWHQRAISNVWWPAGDFSDWHQVSVFTLDVWMLLLGWRKGRWSVKHHAPITLRSFLLGDPAIKEHKSNSANCLQEFTDSSCWWRQKDEIHLQTIN